MNLSHTGSPTSQPPPVGPYEPTADPDPSAHPDETRSDRASFLTSPVRDATSSAKTSAAPRNPARCYAHEVPTS